MDVTSKVVVVSTNASATHRSLPRLGSIVSTVHARKFIEAKVEAE